MVLIVVLWCVIGIELSVSQAAVLVAEARPLLSSPTMVQQD